MIRREYHFFVYIAASRSRQLYVGFTNDLKRRMAEHRERRAGTYAASYNIDRLLYYEHFQYVFNAIARETELKDWNRSKKIALIETINPTWRDLSQDWEEPSTATAEATAKATATAGSSASLRNDKQRAPRNDKTKGAAE